MFNRVKRPVTVVDNSDDQSGIDVEACLTLYCRSPFQPIGAPSGGSGTGPATTSHCGCGAVPAISFDAAPGTECRS